jgi:integrase
MNVSKAAKIWLDYHQLNSKKNTLPLCSNSFIINRFCQSFGELELRSLSVDHILDFLNQLTQGRKPQTKRVRFNSLSAFFNFARENLDQNLVNSCDSPMLRKLFRPKVQAHWDILEKDTVDEIIFRTTKQRDRLMLELMARGAMRVSEVLKLTPSDIVDRKLLLREPKSGREAEMIYIPQKVAERLKEYVRAQRIGLNERIFPICYEAARSVVNKAGSLGRDSSQAARSAPAFGNICQPIRSAH